MKIVAPKGRRMTHAPTKQTKLELAKEALCDPSSERAATPATGAKKIALIVGNKSAENKRFGCHWRYRRSKLGRLAAASPGKEHSAGRLLK